MVKKLIRPSYHGNPHGLSKQVPQQVVPELPFLQSPETERLPVWSNNSSGESLNKPGSLGLWPGRLVIRHVQAVAGELLHSLILLGINTGRWEDVNFKRGLLSVQAAYSKSGQSRVVPLNSKAKLALERLKANARSEWVIATSKGTPYKSVQKMFARARQQAGLRDVTCHTLRHTFASRLVMAGADLRTVQSVGGWKSLSLVERYSHLNENHVAEALERIVGENSTTLLTTPQNDPLIKCV